MRAGRRRPPLQRYGAAPDDGAGSFVTVFRHCAVTCVAAVTAIASPAPADAQFRSAAEPDFTVPVAAQRRLVATSPDGATLEWVCTKVLGSQLAVFVHIGDPRGMADDFMMVQFGRAGIDSWGMIPAALATGRAGLPADRSAVTRETFVQVKDHNNFTRGVLASAGDTLRLKYRVVTGRSVYPAFALPSDTRDSLGQYYRDCGGKELP